MIPEHTKSVCMYIIIRACRCKLMNFGSLRKDLLREQHHLDGKDEGSCRYLIIMIALES